MNQETTSGMGGMVVTPHWQASQVGQAVLQEGGNAVEATVAAAAALCALYPHMTGLGGDGFWLVLEGGASAPVFIDACGRSGHAVGDDYCTRNGLGCLPMRGPHAALTVAGAVSGWEAALGVASGWQHKGHAVQPLARLLAPAAGFAEQGITVTASQAAMTVAKQDQLCQQPGFAEVFLPGGQPPAPGQHMRLPALANTLHRLAHEGLASFYTGAVAADLAADLEAAENALTLHDLQNHTATVGQAVSMNHRLGTFFNCPPPTQGISSLLILGQVLWLLDHAELDVQDEVAFVHAIVECTKTAFLLRNQCVGDPACMAENVQHWVQPEYIASLAKGISMTQAAPWPCQSPAGGDTVWLGAIDRWGNAASCIQSIYHEFGSGVVLPRTGITWHNRALGFGLYKGHPNALGPGKKPFHTLNPAMARLAGGRLAVYGTMGGEGQPQTQGAVLLRWLLGGMNPQTAVSRPRWLLGRAWGDVSDSLKVEADFAPHVLLRLREMGHEVELTPACNPLMGHAGLIVREADGALQGGADPRGDGCVAGGTPVGLRGTTKK